MAGGGGGKGGKGGGGGGSIDVTSTSTSTIDSESTINSTSNSQLDANTTAQLQIAGLDNVRVTSNADSKNDVRLAITEPIRTDSSSRMELDVKPLQTEFCLKLGLDRFPSTKICKPIHKHIGITMFGQELFGLSYSEEKKTIIEDLGHRPVVIGGPETHDCKEKSKSPPDSGGLRLRVG
jgi:hypothetical protein